MRRTHSTRPIRSTITPTSPDLARLRSTDPAAYPVVPPLAGYGPGERDAAVHGWGRHQALLSGWGLNNTVVTGAGVIDGRGNVADPELGSSWVTRFLNLRNCSPPRGKGCGGFKPEELLDFGRPRLWEPMFGTRQALVNVSVRNQAFCPFSAGGS